ncbi:hypothetical protein K440DRAFT_660453 [Wilcoxina mikolae CBS 423.85]|nr:hypothetical protein K440DRAFT_660453 [Wilcoxina mikolae CBS 423.85]
MDEFTPFEDSTACYTPDSSDTDTKHIPLCDSTTVPTGQAAARPLRSAKRLRRRKLLLNKSPSATSGNDLSNRDGEATGVRPFRRWLNLAGNNLFNASAKITDFTTTLSSQGRRYWVYILAVVGVLALGRLSFLHLQPPNNNVWEGAGNFPGLIDLQTHFEGVLENNLGGIMMAMDLKNSESAVRDLNTLVKYSKLPNRDDVSTSLVDFVQSAKSTSLQLSRFSSRVGGTSDKLLAVDRSAIRALERLAAARNSASSHNAVGNLLLSPLDPHYSIITAAERSAKLVYTQGTLTVESAISSLIKEAMIALKMLDDLKHKLSTIEDIAQREKAFVKDQRQAEKRSPLGEWWKSLTSNGVDAENFANHLELLTGISEYRGAAEGLVESSLVQLHKMQYSLEELRETVASPGLLGDGGENLESVPLEEQIRSIRSSVEKLSESRKKAKDRDDEYLRQLQAAQDEAFKKFVG